MADLGSVPKSARTWEREQLGVGFAIRDPLFLVRYKGLKRVLSSKCPACSRWLNFTSFEQHVSWPLSFDATTSSSCEALVSAVRSQRCVGCGIHPFQGAESVTLRRIKPTKQQPRRRT